MKIERYILTFLAASLLCLSAFAQTDRKEVRRGNREFRKEQWQDADISYRKALVKDSASVAARYNLANNMYRQKNYDEAAKTIGTLGEVAAALPQGHDICFNEGDIAIARKDWRGAVDAFKKAMIMDPSDMEAKENYAYAKKMLENQQNGGGGQNNQDQNQNQDQNKDQNQNQDQDQNQDQNKDQNQNQDQNQNGNNDNNKDNQDRNGDGQGQQPKISPQQAQQILQAIQTKEKQTQDKVNKEKALILKSQQKEKNW